MAALTILRMRRLALASWLPLVAAAVLPPPARAVAIDWVHVGDPGNACDPQLSGCHGAVPFTYRIVEARGDERCVRRVPEREGCLGPARALQHGDASPSGIARSGSPGNYTYSPIAGRGRMPVTYVSFYDALRFANWMHNGQGHGDTETGAYTLAGGTPIPSNEPLTRNAGASVFIPTDAEWYKAAYYSTGSATYFDYPAGTNTAIVCSLPGPAPNVANCGAAWWATSRTWGATRVRPARTAPSTRAETSSSGRTRCPILENRTIRGGHAGSSPGVALGGSPRVRGSLVRELHHRRSAWRAPLPRRAEVDALARLRSGGDVL